MHWTDGSMDCWTKSQHEAAWLTHFPKTSENFPFNRKLILKRKDSCRNALKDLLVVGMFMDMIIKIDIIAKQKDTDLCNRLSRHKWSWFVCYVQIRPVSLPILDLGLEKLFVLFEVIPVCFLGFYRIFIQGFQT